MPERLVIAADPGKAGALVWGTSKERYHWTKYPEKLEGLKRLFLHVHEEFPPYAYPKRLAFLERNTGYMAGMKTSTKRKGEEEEEEGAVSAKSMFSFGRVTGHLECAFVFEGFEVREVAPLKWMTAAMIVTGQKSLIGERAWKNHLKEKAQERFPSEQVTLANADALLIFHAAVTGRLR